MASLPARIHALGTPAKTLGFVLPITFLVLSLALSGCTARQTSSSATSASSESAPIAEGSQEISSPPSSQSVETVFVDVPDARESASSTSSENGDLAAKLNSTLEKICKKADMKVGATVVDLASGAKAGYNQQKRMTAASTIKLLVAAAFLERVKNEEFSLDDTYELAESDIVGGTGAIGSLGEGAELSYRELLEKMISASDNTAANILIEAVGMDEVNDEAKKLGLSATKLNRLMMDEDAIAEGIENYTSTEDLAKIFELIYRGELVDKKSSKLVLQALEDQDVEEGLLDGLPAKVTFAHKTGTLASAYNDGGIVEGDHPFIIVVMCGGNGFSYDDAVDTMKDISEAVYADIVN